MARRRLGKSGVTCGASRARRPQCIGRLSDQRRCIGAHARWRRTMAKRHPWRSLHAEAVHVVVCARGRRRSNASSGGGWASRAKGVRDGERCRTGCRFRCGVRKVQSRYRRRFRCRSVPGQASSPDQAVARVRRVAVAIGGHALSVCRSGSVVNEPLGRSLPRRVGQPVPEARDLPERQHACQQPDKAQMAANTVGGGVHHRWRVGTRGCHGSARAAWSHRQESNLHLALRRRPFYPLNYGGMGLGARRDRCLIGAAQGARIVGGGSWRKRCRQACWRLSPPPWAQASQQ